MSFGFRQPYQVLVDSELCRASVDHKIELAKQLGTVLQGQVKPMITQCCIHELYLQRELQTAVDLAKTFERRKCNHREPIPGDDCLASVVGDSNKHRYVIATQSNALRTKLRMIPAVPIVHINRSVMILEPPSDVTMRAKLLMEEKALNSASSTEKALLASSSMVTEPPPKKKRGPKGPNPLSVKKKKVPNPPPAAVQAQGKSGSTKEKGKGKSAESEKDTEVSEEKQAERSDATGKRKRSEEEGDEKSGKKQRSMELDTNVVAVGSSRKRRRKRKPSDSLSVPVKVSAS